MLLSSGKTKGARIRLKVAAVDYLSRKRLAPTRCTLLLSASTELAGNQDPTPHNNVQRLELNVLDTTDPPSAATHESVIRSPRPVKLTIRKGALTTTRRLRLVLVNADVPEAAGHPINVSVNAASSDCAPGTVSVSAPSTVVVKGGASPSVQVTLNVAATQFTVANSQSPDRCTAVLEATTGVTANVEPDTSNNTTRLLIDVDDRNDH